MASNNAYVKSQNLSTVWRLWKHVSRSGEDNTTKVQWVHVLMSWTPFHCQFEAVA
jgi:hypothetical protein